MMKRILSTGDSHSTFWNGYHESDVKAGAFMGVDCLHLGPAAAFNLLKADSTVMAIPRLRAHLEANPEVYGVVIFSFGAIDCEYYAVRHAIRDGKGIRAAAAGIAEAYVDLVAGFAAETGLTCLIYGPPPKSTRPLHPDSLVFGTIAERNYAVMAFNEALQRVARWRLRLGCFSIFADLLGPDREVKKQYRGDGIHVDLAALDLGEAALRRELDRLGLLEAYEPALVRSWPIAEAPVLRNVAIGAPLMTRTTHAGHPVSPFGFEPNGQTMFHTDTEDAPEVVIELNATYLINTIKVHNRAVCQERAETIAIAFSRDGERFEDVFAPPTPTAFGSHEDCLVVDLTIGKLARYVKLYLRQQTSLALQCVELWAPTFYSMDHRQPSLIGNAKSAPSPEARGARHGDGDDRDQVVVLSATRP